MKRRSSKSLSHNPSPPTPLPASGARGAGFGIGSKSTRGVAGVDGHRRAALVAEPPVGPVSGGSLRSTPATRRLTALRACARLLGCVLVLGVIQGTACVAAEPAALELVARDPAGHGLLCRSGQKTILIVAGTPEQMGTAHGTLVGKQAKRLVERVLYLVGGADSMRRLSEGPSPTLPSGFWPNATPWPGPQASPFAKGATPTSSRSGFTVAAWPCGVRQPATAPSSTPAC